MEDYKTRWLEQENDRLKKRTSWMGGVIAIGIFLVVMLNASYFEGLYKEVVLPLFSLGIVGWIIYSRLKKK